VSDQTLTTLAIVFMWDPASIKSFWSR